jgi:flagellar motor switch protein FliN
MTEAATVRQPENSQAQLWAQSFSQALAQISGSPVSCAVLPEAPAELSATAETDLWILCAYSGGLRGELSFRLPAASAVRLAQIFMSEPASGTTDLTAEYREATVELLRQIAGILATTLKADWGEVQLRIDAQNSAPSWPPSSTAWVRAGEDPATALLVELHFSAALSAALKADKTAASPVTDPPPPSASPVAASNDIDKLGLLMDVELGVILRFGSRQLLLREVLDLSPGSVINLDRQVQEPVDMLLDGRLLARGEIVVMNGNYGLRITEIGTPANGQ